VTSDPGGSVPADASPLTYLHVVTSAEASAYLQDLLARNASRLADRMIRVVPVEPGSASDPAAVEALVASLGQVEVILTAADLTRVIPSAWQDAVTNGGTATLETFVDALAAEPHSPESERFWAQHDLAAIGRRWAAVVGPERVHVLTLPPDRASWITLWQRCCSVLGTDPQGDDAGARRAPSSALSYSDTELLRRINAELGAALGTAAYDRYVRTFLAGQVLPTEPGATAPPRLDADGHTWAAGIAMRSVDALRGAGIDVVGDLADLVPATGDGEAGPGVSPLVIYPQTAVRAMVALLGKLRDVDPELGRADLEPTGAADDDEAEGDADAEAAPNRARRRRQEAALRHRSEAGSPTASQPVQRTFLHIGTYKTGTSFIQSVLLRNRELLDANDVCYPTDLMNWRLQTHGVRDLLAQPDVDVDVGRSCRRLVETILTSGRSTAVVSVERLSTASTAQARALVRALQPSQVHVIMTLRDLARVLPSDWQSKVKQGATWRFEEYAAAAVQPEGGRGRANRVFWGHHDAVDIAGRWLAAVGREQFHVVTVPPPGAPPALLWERFCDVLGIDPAPYDISQNAKSNFSLTYSDTEFLRQVNRAVGRSIETDARKHWVTRYLANEVLRPAASEPARADRPRLDRDTERWIEAHAAKVVSALNDLDLDVVGDLDELIPRGGAGDASPSRPAEDHPERAAEIVAALLRKLAEVDGTVRIARRLDRRAARGRPAGGSTRRRSGRGRRPGDPG